AIFARLEFPLSTGLMRAATNALHPFRDSAIADSRPEPEPACRAMRLDPVCFRRLVKLTCLLFFNCTYAAAGQPIVLNSNSYAHIVDRFNSLDPTPIKCYIPNTSAWKWMLANVPLFSCPDAQLEETYYFRWWTYRKHIRQTPQGFVVTEFLAPVKHAGPYNTI